MSAFVFVLLGLGMIYLAVSQFRERRRNQEDIPSIDSNELHPSWKYAFRMRRFSRYLDLWIFGILGPVVTLAGLYALLS